MAGVPQVRPHLPAPSRWPPLSACRRFANFEHPWAITKSFLPSPLIHAASYCPTGTFADAVARTCTPCPTGCSSCTNSTLCTACATGLWRITGGVCGAWGPALLLCAGPVLWLPILHAGGAGHPHNLSSNNGPASRPATPQKWRNRRALPAPTGPATTPARPARPPGECRGWGAGALSDGGRHTHSYTCGPQQAQVGGVKNIAANEVQRDLLPTTKTSTSAPRAMAVATTTAPPVPRPNS